tara:strand:- start:79 stop:348 length:270 start_codon:yes stop_codon:yes gene_type:complete
MAESTVPSTDENYVQEIRELRREIGDLREIIIGMKNSTDNMDSHIGFIMGIYDRYRSALDFMSDIFVTVKTRLLLGLASTVPELDDGSE